MSFNNPFKKILALGTIAAAAGSVESNASAADVESGLLAPTGAQTCEDSTSSKPIEILKVKPVGHDAITGTASGRMMAEEVFKDVDPAAIERSPHLEESSSNDECPPLTS